MGVLPSAYRGSRGSQGSSKRPRRSSTQRRVSSSSAPVKSEAEKHAERMANLEKARKAKARKARARKREAKKAKASQ